MNTPRATRDDDSAAWFDALTEGVLTIRRCEHCGHYGRPDTQSCSNCQSHRLEWVPASGRGSVVSTITGHDGDRAVALALVELDEGPWLSVRLTVACPAGAVVLLAVEHLSDGDGEPLPIFRPPN